MKRIVKMVLNRFFYLLSVFIKNRDIRFIYYHDVVLKDGYSYQRIEIEKFKKQMNYLIDNGYRTLSFFDLDNIKTLTLGDKEKLVLITFDDGWLSNYDVVFPIMKKLNLKFNIFLEVVAIGKKEDYITWNMINEMIESGLVGFGAHTLNHIDARLIDKSNIDTEIYQANIKIYNATGLEVNDFCFPYGYYDRKIIDLLNDIKAYKRIYTSDGRGVSNIGNVDLIGRVGIENEDTDKVYISKIEGKYNYYYLVNMVRRLIGGI